MDFIKLYEILYSNRPDTLDEYGFFMLLIDRFIGIEDSTSPTIKNPFLGIEKDTVERYLRRQNPFNKKRLKDARRLRKIDCFAKFISTYYSETQQFNIETELHKYRPNFNDVGDSIAYPITDLFVELLDELINTKAIHKTSVKTDQQSSGTNDNRYYYDPADKKIHINGNVINIPPEISPPDTIEDEEIPYINELLLAYADALGTAPLSKDDIDKLNGKYKDNFIEQRINYYSAIRICRIIREAYSNPEQELKAWKTQTFDYISDTYRDDYPNGYKRLVAVLKKVVDSKTTAAIDSCDKLIQAKDRKGVCHLLANEGDMHWVQEDE